MTAYLDESQHWSEADWANANRKLGSTLIVLRDCVPTDLKVFETGTVWPISHPGEIQFWTYTGPAA